MLHKSCFKSSYLPRKRVDSDMNTHDLWDQSCSEVKQAGHGFDCIISQSQLTQVFSSIKDHISPGVTATTAVSLVHHNGLNRQSRSEGQVLGRWATLLLPSWHGRSVSTDSSQVAPGAVWVPRYLSPQWEFSLIYAAVLDKYFHFQWVP